MKKNINNPVTVNLSNKIAVVIGGSGSIGSEIVKALLGCGAKVVAASRDKIKIANDFKKNKNFCFIKTDILKESNIRSLAEEIYHRYEGLDILILAQGMQIRKHFLQLAQSEWQNVIATNLTGTFLVCKHLIPFMQKKKYGKVIGITSLTAEFGIKNISAYAASKGGMSQFLKTIAVELAKDHINVNMIAPGRIITHMTRDIMHKRSISDSNLRCIPLGRFGVPSDLIGAILLLASQSSDYITGQTIYIDGGWVAGIGNPQG